MPLPPRSPFVASLLALVLTACGEPPTGPVPEGPAPGAPKDAAKDAPAPAPDAAAAKPAAVEPTPAQVAAWTERLQRLAAGFRSLSRVDDMSRWAPALCRRPLRVTVPRSASADEASHGRKLFSVWALDVEAYGKVSGLALEERAPEKVAATPGADGCSQVVVKEAFEPVEMKPDERPDPGALAPAEHDGKRFKPGAPHGLFVMLRLDPATPGTDDGWVYGTLTPKAEVTSVGRVATCMKCHVDAPHGRLFGLPRDTVR